MKGLQSYKTWVFDCDGVLLDSNSVKSEAFYEVALPYGKDNAEALVAYHKEFGGISRFKKIQYFFKQILRKKDFQQEMEEVIDQFGDIVRTRLLKCPETEGLHFFLARISKAKRKIVVSGGMQKELLDVFSQRSLTRYFNNIYGSPDTKPDILKREEEQGLLKLPMVYIGDSKHDYECAKIYNSDFIFMTQYSEFIGWQEYFKDKPVLITSNLKALACQII
jgi:phosphoglycolate phosphatase-like HAD superfamily hydrolase